MTYATPTSSMTVMGVRIFESRVIEIEGVEQGSFQEIQFNIPKWAKQLVGFWSEDSISDQEFINAIKFILESKLDKTYDY